MTRAKCDMKPCLVLAGLVFGVSVGHAAGFAIRGSVIANGGPSSTPATNGTRSVQGTLGQAVVGQSQNGGQEVCSGFWCFGGPRVVAVLPTGLPLRLALGPATPNPTRDRATFRLALPEAAQVTLKVYDVAGRQMGAPVSRPFDAGEHELVWRAQALQPGMYFIRLTTDGILRAKRSVVLVR